MMLDFTSQVEYTPQQVLTLFRAITNHLKLDPMAFQAQGVFRISGDPTHVQQIVTSILNGNKIVDHRFSIHDYISTLKHAIKYSHLLAPDIPTLNTFKANVRANDERCAKLAIPTLINDLANSGDQAQATLAEIIYLYGNILSYAYPLQVKNKMSAENLGIIAGPLFANLIADTPQKMLEDTLKLNELCAYLIGNGLFQKNVPDGIQSMLSDALALCDEEDLQQLLEMHPVFIKTSWQDLPENPLMPYPMPSFEDDDEDEDEDEEKKKIKEKIAIPFG